MGVCGCSLAFRDAAANVVGQGSAAVDINAALVKPDRRCFGLVDVQVAGNVPHTTAVADNVPGEIPFASCSAGKEFRTARRQTVYRCVGAHVPFRIGLNDRGFKRWPFECQ